MLDKIDEYWGTIVFSRYEKIMAEEAKLSPTIWKTPTTDEVFHTVKQIIEVMRSSMVIRSYHKQYNLSYLPMAFESDSAHTNLMATILDRALSYLYGPAFHYTDDGYNYREIMEAVRRHDLPENITGDIPDDGTRDEATKNQLEQEYQRAFSSHSPSREVDFEKKVLCLLTEMEGKTSPTGKLLYAADKVSAILMVLCYDKVGLSPHHRFKKEFTTASGRQAAKICERTTVNGYLASEIWTIDYFKMRKLVQYDETGYFTALLVMTTLQVHHDWYSWREADYSNNYTT